MQAYSLPCWWVGWWLWRAGCISQDTYLLYIVISWEETNLPRERGEGNYGDARKNICFSRRCFLNSLSQQCYTMLDDARVAYIGAQRSWIHYMNDAKIQLVNCDVLPGLNTSDPSGRALLLDLAFQPTLVALAGVDYEHNDGKSWRENSHKGWGQSAKLKKHSRIWGKFGTAIQGYILNPCTKFPPNPTSRKANT